MNAFVQELATVLVLASAVGFIVWRWRQRRLAPSPCSSVSLRSRAPSDGRVHLPVVR